MPSSLQSAAVCKYFSLSVLLLRDDDLSEEEHLGGQGPHRCLGGGMMWWFPPPVDLHAKVNRQFAWGEECWFSSFQCSLLSWGNGYDFFSSWRFTVVCLLTLKNRNVNNESLRDIFLFSFSFASFFFFQTSENNLWTGLVFSPLSYTFPVSQPHFFSIRSHHQL